MKKKYLGILACLLCLMVLSGCCSHQWVEATCDAPKTCASCAETEGEALGHNWQEASCASPKHCEACGLTEGAALEHSWQEADCETPKTCTLCGSTEGEAPGHSFTPWIFEEETMHRTCQICALEESQSIDREIYLRQQLEGYWGYYNITVDEPSPHLICTEDTVRYYFDYTASTTCELQLSGYDAETNCYDAVLETSEGEAFLLRYAAEEASLKVKTPSGSIDLKKVEHLDLVTGRTWAGYCLGTLYLLDFNPDGTVTGTIGTPTEQSPGDPVSGTWVASTYSDRFEMLPFRINLSDRELPMRNPGINMDYVYDDSMPDYLRYPYIIMTDADDMPFSLTPIAEEAVDNWVTAALEAESNLLGTWYSEYTSKGGNSQSAQEYTITFLEDGTLTANLDQALHGTWKILRMELTDGPASIPNIRYEIDLPPYDLLQISQGQLSLYSHQTDLGISFWLPEDRDAVRNKVAGNWVSTSISCHPVSGGDAVERGDAEEYRITFTADGTICGNIGQEIQDAYLILPGRNEEWQLQIPLAGTKHGVTVHVYENDTIAVSYSDSQYAYWIEFAKE